MSRSTHVCDGCRMELSFRDELDKELGEVYDSWNCAYCGTSVPGVVAEKIKHQRRH